MSSVAAGAAREWRGEIPLFERSRLRGNLYYKNDGSAIRWAKRVPTFRRYWTVAVSSCDLTLACAE
jgi:hypothetical protein